MKVMLRIDTMGPHLCREARALEPVCDCFWRHLTTICIYALLSALGCALQGQQQAQQQAAGDRPRFQLTRIDAWHGLRGLLELSHAAALSAMLCEIPNLPEVIITAATSAEKRSFVAVGCLHELFGTLGLQVPVISPQIGTTASAWRFYDRTDCAQ